MASQHRQIALLTTVLLGCFAVACEARSAAPSARQLNPEADPLDEGVRNNLISTLTRIGNSSEVGGVNVSRAAALLIRSIVREGFNVGSVATYVPKLLFLDGPNQFIEVLRLMRADQIRVPNDLDSAIDTLIRFTGSVRDSGSPSNFFPVVEFFPNIFTGVETFAQDALYNVFAWLGPIQPVSSLDQSIVQQSVRIVSTTQANVV